MPGLKDAPELRGTVSSGLASGGRAGAPSSYAAFRDTRTDSPTPAFPRGRDRRETRTLQGQNPIYAGRAAPCALRHRALCSGTTARFKQQDRTHVGAPSCRWSAGPRPRTRPAPRNPVPSPLPRLAPCLSQRAHTTQCLSKNINDTWAKFYLKKTFLGEKTQNPTQRHNGDTASRQTHRDTHFLRRRP